MPENTFSRLAMCPVAFADLGDGGQNPLVTYDPATVSILAELVGLKLSNSNATSPRHHHRVRACVFVRERVRETRARPTLSCTPRARVPFAPS